MQNVLRLALLTGTLGPAASFPALAQTQARPPADTGASVVRPDELQWRDSPSGAMFARGHGNPAREGVFAFRMKVPAGWVMTPHRHNTGEYITVVSGRLFMRFAEKGKEVELPAGSLVAVPAGRPMWAWTTTEPAELQIHGMGPFATTPLEANSSSR
jgi:quercetin dioxygenase-like cupin family protein